MNSLRLSHQLESSCAMFYHLCFAQLRLLISWLQAAQLASLISWTERSRSTLHPIASDISPEYLGSASCYRPG
jgi:hypothetical protein